jgi:hypothetical protein
MSNLQSFNLVSHYTGEASTAGSAVLNLATDFAGSSTGSPVTSFVKWKPATQSAAPDKRFFRSFKTQSFAYLITLKPTTPSWQTRLSELEIGYTRFVRPNHVHCIPGVPVAPGTTDFNWPGILTPHSGPSFTYDGTTVVPYATLECFVTGGTLLYRRVGTSDGKILADGNIVGCDYWRIVDQTGVWGISVGGNYAPASNPRTLGYMLTHTSSNVIKDNIWPQDTFTAWGAAFVQADRDWMPRVIPTHVSAGSPVDFDASMTLWRIGNSRLDLTSTAYYATARADATPTVNLASPTAPFAFSRHESLPPGLYWRASSYPGSYATGAARWAAVPGSDVTGYTAPTEEPSCPFVVKTGTI